jgi:hypothetical protein
MKFYKSAFFAILILILIGAAFYLGTNYNKSSEDETAAFTKDQSEEIVEETDETATPSSQTVLNLDEVKENLIAAIETGNYQAIESFMTDEVVVILEASGCCGDLSKEDAAQQLDYLNEAQGPWNFDQTNQTIMQLKEVEPEKYGPETSLVGIASNEYVVVFKFDDNHNVSGITMAVTYKLVLP